MLKISIIVPVYNVEKYLDKCMKSILNQTLQDIEIICVNDGSTDNSLNILEKYALKDNRIKIINIENSGPSKARNIGIQEATGEYIGFVDSDDWIDKNYYEKLYNTAKKYDAEIACAGFRRCKYGNGSIRLHFKKEILTNDINEKVKLNNIPEYNYVMTKIYNRQKWLETGISFPEGRKYEDMAIILKILNNFNPMVTVPNTYYHYLRRKSSLITGKISEIKQELEQAKQEMFDYAKENNITIKQREEMIEKLYVKFLGLKILKIKKYETKQEILLFGFIPILTIIKA